MTIVIPVLSLCFWSIGLIGDLRRRSVPIWALIGISIVALIGQAWPWWVLVFLTLAWPSRKSVVVLAPVAVAAGILLQSPAPGMAIAVGCIAWALGWWGGADSILLIALALRFGIVGLISGTLVTALAGLVIMIVRGRSILGLITVLPEAVSLQARDEIDIPAEAEMPAAAAMALPGICLSIAEILSLVSRGIG